MGAKANRKRINKESCRTTHHINFNFLDLEAQNDGPNETEN